VSQKEAGFYVDVGAHHPKRFSNTYKLYLRGWRGLNVDATPGSMALFKSVRPRDINVEAAVGGAGRQITFYLFSDPALNTSQRELALQRADGAYRLTGEVKLATTPLADLLDEYLPKGVHIDVLSVDVEGADYDVLCSNDWNRYRPEYVLVESVDCLNLADAFSDVVCRFLLDKGYAIVAKTMHTLIFQRL
jgi:FkbM family methyltransferase